MRIQPALFESSQMPNKNQNNKHGGMFLYILCIILFVLTIFVVNWIIVSKKYKNRHDKHEHTAIAPSRGKALGDERNPLLRRSEKGFKASEKLFFSLVCQPFLVGALKPVENIFLSHF